MNKLALLVFTFICSQLILVSSAIADESSFVLKTAPGVDMLYAKCVGCHSLDYIEMNSPFMDRKSWEKTVTKMIKVMGAQVTPEEEQIILNYLTKNYGKEK